MDLPATAAAWLRLALAPGLTAGEARRLVEGSGSAEAAARGRLRDLSAVVGHERASGLSRELGEAPVEKVAARAAALGQRILAASDADWPQALRELPDPPRVLFLRGRLPPPGAPAVAVVGTRQATPYGLRIAREMSEQLASAGVWIVSGLALGIDAEAHAGALGAAARGGASTVAVLGCGLDVPYPARNREIRERIPETGGLLAEFPPGTPGLKPHFPLRNRIVAALARITVVVEAPAASGALITARLAVDLGRDVAAVPGPIGRPTQEGCHRLIQKGGAALVTGAADLRELLGLPETVSGSAPPAPPPPPGPARLVWEALDPADPLDADELCRRTGLSSVDVARALTWLEIDGRARRVPGLGLLRLS